MSFLDNKPKVWALIPAAGIGSRMKSGIPKQYLHVDGKMILEHTIEQFLSHPDIYKIMLVIHPEDRHWDELNLSNNPKIKIAIGGDERANSVLNGLKEIQQSQSEAHTDDWIMVHDAARPCLSKQNIDDLLQAQASSPDGAILAIPAIDTVKVTNSAQAIDKTIPRESIWLAQTPQFFPLHLLTDSIEKSLQDNRVITDEASALENQGLHPSLVIGSRKNIKITTPEDLILASIFLQSN